ncbi:MAG: lytic transglycosylase domain-containing protein [Desulfovibrio sp.]|jgi:soluble lytic murein transglycosylase-like protein|nr:lytic transglycosylase domain-containing protein [Desulfovibrio sp.]
MFHPLFRRPNNAARPARIRRARLFRAGLADLAAFFLFVCCACAQPAQKNAPLNKSAAWQQGLTQLERYKQGGAPPQPLRVGISFSSPLPAFAPQNTDPDWKSIIQAASRRHGLDEALLAAVMQVESRFNPSAVSPDGARGVMQIMPLTGRELGLENFFDPAANTDAGARYLAEMLRMFSRLDLSLAAYNAGPGAVRQYGGRIPPYRETQDYVARVLALYNSKRINAQREK